MPRRAESAVRACPRSAPALRASVHTLGCRLNQSETALIVERLRSAGYEIVPFGAPADLGILNTCTVTREADAKSRQLIRSFVRKNPEAYTAVIGCYSQVGYQALAEIEGIDLIIGSQDKLHVLEYVAQGKNERPLIVRDQIQRDDFSIEFAGDTPVDKRANLKIQDGCNFVCSYCIIPSARGRSRSRDLDNLLDEARSLVRRGAKELVLTGVNIGDYSFEGQTVFDVVQRLDEISGLERIRISSIEPTTIPEALFARMNDPDHALTPHLHIPLQSGSDRVLALMKRRYTRAEFLDFIEAAARAVPGLCIGTDVMVGMPGERDEDFEETVDLLARAPVAYAHVFKYSERDGAPSARFPDKVSPDVVARRSARLRRLSAEKRNAFYEGFLGGVAEVLFEQKEGGNWSGYTGNYIRVLARSTECIRNVSRPVRLERISGDAVIGTVQ